MKDEITYDRNAESTGRRRRDKSGREEKYDEDIGVDERERPDEDEYDEDQYDEDEYDEDEYDENEYDEDEYGDDGEDEAQQDDEYDDDVFSLDEDLKREQRKQFVQYVCVAIGAVAIIALALFASVKLTHNRLDEEKNAAILAAKALEAQTLEQQTAGDVVAPIVMEDWPSSQFPGIPALDSPAYETTVLDGYAKIAVPSSATDGYDDYIDALCEEYSAKVYIRTGRLCVLDVNDVEVHLLMGTQQNRIVLCDEKAIEFADVDYRAFDVPSGFKLVSAKADSAMGRVLTYRLVPVNKALEYAASLVNQYGWKLTGNFDVSENTFYAVYSKNNLQMTVDYFSSSDDFKIKLDYVN